MIRPLRPATLALVSDLGELARQVDREDLLSAASGTARQEWLALRGRWPTPADIEAGTITLSDEELAVMANKVRRFRSILVSLKRRDGGVATGAT